MTDPDRKRSLDGLPPDDYLVVARREDLALARRIVAECRRPVPDVNLNWNAQGPTEMWRQHLAVTDPEWAEAAA